MFGLAGLAISGINSLLTFRKAYKDWSSWEERDVEVELGYLDVALKKGVIEGNKDEFAWIRIERLPTAELEGAHCAVVAINVEKKIKYRIVVGRPDDRVILVRRTTPDAQLARRYHSQAGRAREVYVGADAARVEAVFEQRASSQAVDEPTM